MKGIRGEHSNKLGMIMVLKSENDRAIYWNELATIPAFYNGPAKPSLKKATINSNILKTINVLKFTQLIS